MRLGEEVGAEQGQIGCLQSERITHTDERRVCLTMGHGGPKEAPQTIKSINLMRFDVPLLLLCILGPQGRIIPPGVISDLIR